MDETQHAMTRVVRQAQALRPRASTRARWAHPRNVGGAREVEVEVPFNPTAVQVRLAPVLREGLDVTVRGSDMLNSGRT